MTPMDRWIELLRPEDVPGALHLLDVMEEFGQISPAEASEWRRRIGGWREYRAVADGAPPNA